MNENYAYNIKEIEEIANIAIWEFDIQRNPPTLKHYFKDYRKMCVVGFQHMNGWHLVTCGVKGDNLF